MHVDTTLSNSTSVVPSGCVHDAGETILTPHKNPEGEKKKCSLEGTSITVEKFKSPVPEESGMDVSTSSSPQSASYSLFPKDDTANLLLYRLDDDWGMSSPFDGSLSPFFSRGIFHPY